MGKIIGFELKKLVSRIGIYILVVLMAGLLVAGVFMYDPIERNTNTKTLVGETVSDMYANFTNDLKQGYLNTIAGVAEDANTYVNTSANYNQSNDKQYIDNLFEAFDSYCLLYYTDDVTNSEYNTLLVGIKQSLTNLKNALDNGLNSVKNTEGYYILTTNDNYVKLYSLINNITSNFGSPTSHKLAGEKYVTELKPPFVEALNNLVYPNLSNTANKYSVGGSYYALITSRMEEIEHKMKDEHDKVLISSSLEQNKDIKNNLNELFNRYVNCVEVFETSYASSMCVDALSTISSKNQRSKLLGYSNVSLYQQEEIALQYDYYIENHSSPLDYANGLSITHTSNGKINAYDFTFFVMSIFAIIVLVFAIYLSAHTISGEINNNTMRFTAIRPVKRSSVFVGKYLAIILMSLILLLFGTITSLTVGGILYGFDSANILMVINGYWIFNIHPLIVIGLFVISLLLIIAVYTAITLMLSTIFKSDLLAMIIGVVIYIINFILPLFFGMTSWLKFNPLCNINLFSYLGSTSVTNDTILAKLFNNIVYQGMSIWISLIYVFGITTLLLIIGCQIFKKREL